MAKEYIDREAFMENVRLKYCKDCTSYNGLRCGSCWVDDMEDAIEDAPIADVTEVRHGKWTNHGIADLCNICNAWIVVEQGTAELNYCTNCGAKMDGKDE